MLTPLGSGVMKQALFCLLFLLVVIGAGVSLHAARAFEADRQPKLAALTTDQADGLAIGAAPTPSRLVPLIVYVSLALGGLILSGGLLTWRERQFELGKHDA